MNIEPNISVGIQISLITWPGKQELNSSTAPLKGFRGTPILFILPDAYVLRKLLLYLSLEKQRLAFVPPNPKLFDIDTFTSLSWACPGM